MQPRTGLTLELQHPRAAHTASVATRAYTAELYGDGNPLDVRTHDVDYLVFEPPSISSDTTIGSL